MTDNHSINDTVVYVWDFKVSDASLKDIGSKLTDDFEAELIRFGHYKVLERRHYNQVLLHNEMENRISDIHNLSSTSKDNLRAERAEVVIFGDVMDDINSGEFEVTVRFQNLSNGEILKKMSILIKRGLIADNQTRKKYMRDLVNSLHARELLTAKQEQYNIVQMLLRNYILSLKDLQKEFQDMVPFAFDSDYVEELNKKITDYNAVFQDLNNNQAAYIMDFTTHWNESYGKELEDIVNGILDDIHKTYILKLDKVRLAIGEYGISKSSAGEKKKLKNQIINDVRKTTDDLDRQINIMDLKINTFLARLNEAMHG